MEPVPSWTVSCPFDLDHRPKKTEQLTTLLFSQQVHAELRQIHLHNAVRLETMQAVQNLSQWRLQFEPRIQKLSLHWIRIHRAGQVTDHLNLEKFRFLQRAEGLEGFLIDGWVTLLLVLEDVRPGDVLESCYTIETHSTVLPEYCTFFFNLPQRIPVGRYHFSLKFDASCQMRWKSSSPELRPAESHEGNEAVWVWTGENLAGVEPEPNTPAWLIDCLWIQISDCPDWEKVAASVSQKWKEVEGDALLVEIAQGLMVEQPALQGLEDKEAELVLRVEKALRLVQDEFRYLSVELEVGGHLPAPPGIVARRRFGDCKDLSFVLVHLLKLLGVPARPVLVNTRLRKTIAQMLPAALFNHAVVEYRLRGETRWVDATMRQQGGGALNRFIPDYGVGLPIGSGSSGSSEAPETQKQSNLFELGGGESSWLIEAPPTSAQSSLFELRETLLLDTTGKASVLAVVVIAKGGHAESLRHQFETQGMEAFAKSRLQLCANRFANAKRVSPLQHRDDRSANEFVLAEMFEVNGFLTMHAAAKMCRLNPPGNLVLGFLPLPETSSRRNPFALPYPCNIVHVFEVQSASAAGINRPDHKINSPFLRFECTHAVSKGSWSMTSELCTLVDSVPPDRISIYDRTVREIRSYFDWHIKAPLGHRHPQGKRGFGELPSASGPASKEASAAKSRAPRAEEVLERAVALAGHSASRSERTGKRGSSSQSPLPEDQRHSRRRRARGWSGRRLLWPLIIGAMALALIIVIILAAR